MTLTTILHPTDFSASADHALRLAARLAVSHDATLHLFHASTLHMDDAAAEAEALDACAARARVLFQQSGRKPLPELRVTASRAVFAFDAIMEVASEQKADLIVIGTHGRSGISKLLMGSTAEKLLRHAPCHVLTVKEAASDAAVFRRLLVPVDFSPWASRGLDGARALKEEADVTIYLVHVVAPLPPMYYAGGVSTRFELDADLRERIERGLRAWAGDVDDTRTKIMITEGNPALEVVRLADELAVDLIVMSTKGLTGAEHLLVGSVTERVCRFASVPVLAMR